MPRPPVSSPGPVPAPASSGRATGVLWPATLLTLLCGYGGAVSLLAAQRLATAVLLGTLMVLALCGLEALRRQHRTAVAEGESLGLELARRAAQSERRDADWQSYLTEQSELMRLELEHFVKERLP
ncbi:hypothetical protein GA0115252_10761, partial [Streptomyces sp. DfronAA-171]